MSAWLLTHGLTKKDIVYLIVNTIGLFCLLEIRRGLFAVASSVREATRKLTSKE